MRLRLPSPLTSSLSRAGRTRAAGTPAAEAAPPVDRHALRHAPLVALAQELARAVELQETADRVIAGCAGSWPVDGCWSAEGAPVVTELLRIASRIGDLDVAEQDAEVKEDACYLVLWHQAAVDRALRLAYTADATDSSEQERRALDGLGAPREQLRALRDEVRGRIRAIAESTTTSSTAEGAAQPVDGSGAGDASGTSTQNSLPSTSASTTQLTSSP